MRKKFVTLLACLIAFSVCFMNASAATLKEDKSALDPINYTLYGNGDEYCRYNNETKSLDVMAHTAYKNGFAMSQNDVISVKLSAESTYGKWLGIGFLGEPTYGAPASGSDGVMLYITTESTNTYYDFRIFQINAPFKELTHYLTDIKVGTAFTLSLKYDSSKNSYFYYVNDKQVYSGENYFDGEKFIDNSGKTYLNFAYENNGKDTPIKIYSVSATGTASTTATTAATTSRPSNTTSKASQSASNTTKLDSTNTTSNSEDAAPGNSSENNDLTSSSPTKTDVTYIETEEYFIPLPLIIILVVALLAAAAVSVWLIIRKKKLSEQVK